MLTNLAISSALCTLTVCGFVVGAPETAHWFVVPVWLCGVLIGCDAVDWFRGRLALFDPAGIIGLIGLHFFFLAPLLHVAWDTWMPYVEAPPDWRPWLGAMAIVNAAGLLLYRGGRERSAGRPEPARGDHARALDTGKVLFAAVCGMAISAGLQLLVYVEHGGILGYVDAFTRSVGLPQTQSAFAGMGWVFILSESFPILAMLVLCGPGARAWAGRGW
jgi:hypothetical protein